ncbi:MAG TPA: hypothetical protein VEQ12_10070 [Candidatus Limnocylindria bacterium]|nr:hypothetical protein [Candidatus Limnocylindria bacterium]
MGFGLVGAAGRPLPGARSRRGLLADHQGCHHAAPCGLGPHHAGAPGRAGPACAIAERPRTGRKPVANAAADGLQQPSAVIVFTPDQSYAYANRYWREPIAVRFAQPELLGVRDAHADPNAYGQRNADTDADAYANTDAYTHADADPDSNTNAYANPDPDAHAVTHPLPEIPGRHLQELMA